MAMTKKVPRLGMAFGVAALLVVVSSLSLHWIANAQQGELGDDPRFTGRSETLDTGGLRISRRSFEAGARSAWHRHPGGQLLFVEEGGARTQQRGAAMRELGVGESDYAGPNVEHWHGAVPHTHFVQVAVVLGAGDTEWLEKVSDDEYHGR
jgi:quercetin dioxygenase-like cupin family protein